MITTRQVLRQLARLDPFGDDEVLFELIMDNGSRVLLGVKEVVGARLTSKSNVVGDKAIVLRMDPDRRPVTMWKP